MALVIRLSKTGTKKKIKHRIVVTDNRFPPNGRFIENIGYWNPNVEPPDFKVDLGKADEWIGKGARPSPVVRQILKLAGLKFGA